MLTKKTKAVIDEFLQNTDEDYKKRLSQKIDEVINILPIMFNSPRYANKHYGICSVLFITGYDDAKEPTYLYPFLVRVITSLPKKWVVSDDDTPIRKINSNFVWKPGNIKPRIKFLKEVKEYINC